MPTKGLIDAGAILALLDKNDSWHRACVEAFQQFRLPLVTSEAVLTELFHLAGSNPYEVQTAWKFLQSGAIMLPGIQYSELAGPHPRSDGAIL